MEINEMKPPGVSDKDVKAMTPSFKSRYGDKWKDVMYATMWKRHGQKEDLRLEMINYIWEHVHPSRKIEENQAILVSHPELGREPRPLHEMSSDELEHHYHNIHITEGTIHLKAQEKEGFEAFKGGKAHAENPHPKGSQKAYHWTSGHKIGAAMAARKMFKEDAVDDQLAKHGMSRKSLDKKVTLQRQQFQGRKQEAQHSAKNEAWSTKYETPKSKKGIFKGRSLSSLEKQDKSASGTKKKQVDFAIRAKTGWGRV